LLLEKNPYCNQIYLQTDDYTSFKNLKKYIDENQLNIKLSTLCHESSTGVIVTNNQKELLNSASIHNEINKNYLSGIISNLNNTKSAQDMSSEEKYKHTIDMIVGIDLVLNSNICVTDYQSNVSRFIKLTHKTPENVFDIHNTDIEYDKKVCPAWGF